MASSDSEHESSTEFNLTDVLQRVNCMLDGLILALDDDSEISSSSDSDENAFDENWSKCENETTENRDVSLENDGVVNHAFVTDDNHKHSVFNMEDVTESDSTEEENIDANYTLNNDDSYLKHCEDNQESQNVFKKLYDVFTEFQAKNQLPRDTAREKGADVENEQCGWTDAMCDVIRELVDFWDQLYSGDDLAANTEHCAWTDAICDVIHELVSFWHLLNSGGDNEANIEMKSEKRDMKEATAEDSSDPNIGNIDYKKDTITSEVTNWTDFVKNLVTDTLKVLLWVCSGRREVAAESFIADNVVFCSDGPRSINQLLSDFSNRDLTIDNMVLILRILQWLTDNIVNKGFFLAMQTVSHSETGPMDPDSTFIQDTFKFIHWLNDNSCQLTNNELTDTDKKTNEVSCLISWVYSLLRSIDQFNEVFQKLVYSLNAMQLYKVDTYICALCIPLFILLLVDYGSIIIPGIQTIGEISPQCGYLVRKLIHCLLSVFFNFFSKKLPFAEKTCVFGKRLVKEVSVFELLCFMNEDQQPTPSEFTELQEIVKKLSEDFQVQHISTRFKPEVFPSKQHDDAVIPQTDTADECESVVDMLWVSYEDTLSQSNWCNVVADVTKVLDMLVNDVRKFYNLEPHQCSAPVLSGSRSDGCISLLSGPGNACDFDMLDPILNTDSLRMECIPGHPAYIILKGSPACRLSSYLLHNSWLNKSLFKRGILSQTGLNEISKPGPLCLFQFLSCKFSQFHRRLNTACSLQLGDVACTYLLFKGDDVMLSIDWAGAIVINSWPDQAHGWIERNSAWPTLDIKEAIARTGCHAVHKIRKGGDPDREWRLSFSKAENTLCKIFTPSQAFHLSLLKTQFQNVKSKIGSYEDRIFKNYTITKGKFHTYHAKTAMFWFCDNHPPTHHIWRKENVFRCQSKLLESMEGMMREGNIPHYFIPEQNLLEDIPAELLPQAAEELHALKEDARTENGRVYQQIIKQTHEKDRFSQYLSAAGFKDMYLPT